MKKWIGIVAAVLIALPMIVSAHSGGTDSHGGHRDNKNVSGLGSYHYHHGRGAHLHPGGVCPYSAKPQATAKASSGYSYNGGSSYNSGKSIYNTTAAPPRYNTKAPTPKPTVKPTPTPTATLTERPVEALKPIATQTPWYKNVFEIAETIVICAPFAFLALLTVCRIVGLAWWRISEIAERFKRR